MKYNLTGILSVFLITFSFFQSCTPAKEAQLSQVKQSNQFDKVKLTQTPGAFATQSLALTPGDYQFEIVNDGVDHEVGFVLVPKGKYDAADHIKAAYVTAPVATGKSSMTNVVALEAGAYEYFCPLNPTDKYPLLVGTPEKVTLTQIPGEFENTSLNLEAGLYQFEIANKGVDHEVGFVLVPKGKYDAADHIKAAYVTAPVATGKSSMTNVVALEAGAYEYFCPLNPTDKYPLLVGTPKKVTLTQIPGEFENTSLNLEEGLYQFEIANKGVDHEVGFVLVPKGKYDAADHIKAAYVTAPVATGKSSMTNVVALEAGAYEYFCPLNPTDKYPLLVGTPEKVTLTQIPGEFENTSLNLEAGLYQFEIANKGVDHEVGFVLVPKGKYDAADHIKAAYVTAPVATGKSSMTNVVALEAGAYEYFCPLNPTDKYPLLVGTPKKVTLTQIPGEFETTSLNLKAGLYQFEIANKGVDHEVGFVLVPKGKYDAADHIKAAYVTAPVATGKSSMTNVVALEAGAYEYFCPLNPTDKYSLTVK